jgi:hypothetical protein
VAIGAWFNNIHKGDLKLNSNLNPKLHCRDIVAGTLTLE